VSQGLRSTFLSRIPPSWDFDAMLVEKRKTNRTATSPIRRRRLSFLSRSKNVEDQIGAAQAVLSRTTCLFWHLLDHHHPWHATDSISLWGTHAGWALWVCEFSANGYSSPPDTPHRRTSQAGTYWTSEKSGVSAGALKKKPSGWVVVKGMVVEAATTWVVDVETEDDIPVEPMTMFDGGTFWSRWGKHGRGGGCWNRKGSESLFAGSRGIGSNGAKKE